jgi:DNA-binding winged helix-turn-helix (wHTH) protein/Flp pilus assembly protein TadD
MQREQYQIADLTLDVDAVSLLRDGEPVALPRLSFDLLVVLVRRAPSVVGFEELIETVWAGTAVSDETLTQRVALLRRALGDEAKNPRYLRAVRGRGYQLVPEVRMVIEEEIAPLAPPPQETDWRRIGVAAAAALALVVLGIAFWPSFLHRTAAAVPVTTRSPGVPELLSRAGTYLSLQQEPNNQLAIELYQRALQLEPENPQALAGLSLALGQRVTKFNGNAEAGDRALELARRAVALEPELGRAHHALGLALDSRGQVSAALAAYLRAAELEPEPAAALASAAHLMQVEGNLAAALEADLRAARAGGETPPYLEIQIGSTLGLLGFDQAAAVWFERALELRPDNVFAAAAFARMRLSQARLREADQIATKAIARGIHRPELAALRGTVALLEGNEPQAKTFFREALTIEPDFLPARTRLLLLNRHEPGRGSEARQLIDGIHRGRAAGDEWPDSAIEEALLESGFGRHDEALHALDTAIDLGYRDAGWLLLDPMLAGLRKEPSFLRRIETIRRRVDAERQRVVGAGWLPPALLDGSAARM